MLYSANSANFLLGSLMNNPTLLFSEKVKLDKSDFEPQLFHKIIFVCIYNLAIKNVKSIDSISIQEWLSNYKPQLEIFMRNNGVKYVETVKQIANDDTFEYYYDRIKTFSLLREYKANGFDISQIFDETKNEETQKAKLDEWNVVKIIDWFKRKQNDIEHKFEVSMEYERGICGQNGKELVESLAITPDIGNGMASPYYNELSRGWKRGSFSLIGAGTAFGKSITLGMHLCSVACDMIWSDEQNNYIQNPQYIKGTKGALIFTEQSMKEVELRLYSTLSKVNYGKIMDGRLTKEEKERVIKASEITKRCEIELINLPDVTIKSLKVILQDLALKGVTHTCYDYIWSSPSLIQEYKKENQGAVNETSVLLNLGSVLKLESERLNLATMSAMQLNGKQDGEIVDVDCLFASRSIATKCDFISIMVKPKQKELTLVQPLIDKWNNENNSDLIPNTVSHIVKARFGRYNNIKIFSYLDRGTGTITDMFTVTGVDCQYINVPKLIIKSINA